MARLPVYLRILSSSPTTASTSVSSERLAELAGVNAAKVRKDLSYLGSYGTRGVGYDVEYLLYQMSRELGLTHDWPVVIVGAGNLGQALANYGGFGERGFPVAALVDVDPAKVGTRIGAGSRSRHIDDLPEHRRPSGGTRSASSPPRPAPPRRWPTGWSRAGVTVDPELRPGGAHRAPGRVASARSTWPSSCRS